MQDPWTYSKILIERADNGGWSVFEFAHRGHLIACYSDHADLIAGLDDLLDPCPYDSEELEETLAELAAESPF